MRTTTSAILCLFICLCAATAEASNASLASGAKSGSHLFRRQITIANQETVQIQLTGCSGSEDTMLFLLNLNTTDPSSIRISEAFNDDQGSGFTEPRCSYINYKNISGFNQTYEIIGTIYPGTPGATVNYNLWRASTGWVAESNLYINGFTENVASTGLRHMTVPRNSDATGGPVDTILYVIDTRGGGIARVDDDKGVVGLSDTDTFQLSCSSSSCWQVAGHYHYGDGGEAFEVWSYDSNTDSDSDGIKNDIENLKGSDPNNNDTDKDGLKDELEYLGVKATNLAGFDDTLVLPWQGTGSDVLFEDIFLEIDWMADATHTHLPAASMKSDMVSVFQQDSSFTGRVIRPHVEYSANVGHWTNTSFDCPTDTNTKNFYELKSANFDAKRNGVYHYSIAGHGFKEPDAMSVCTATLNSGLGEILGNDYYSAPGNAATAGFVRATNIHELGHNLYLDHNSNDDPTATNRSCVHSSVMNYRYQTTNGYPNSGGTLRGFGYSSGACLSGSSGGCANTCVTSCVPSGQVTPKITCPVATSGPNMGLRVSNGTCDCDRAEWTFPGASPIANRVSLKFQGAPESSDGAPLEGGLTEDDYRAFESGVEAHKKGMSEKMKGIGRSKKAFVERQGMVEGRDFIVSKTTGKLLSAHR